MQSTHLHYMQVFVFDAPVSLFMRLTSAIFRKSLILYKYNFA